MHRSAGLTIRVKIRYNARTAEDDTPHPGGPQGLFFADSSRKGGCSASGMDGMTVAFSAQHRHS